MADFSDTPMSPSRNPFAITPHNTNALSSVPKALWIGTGGDVVLRGQDGSADVTFKNVPTGSVLAVRPSHVRSTGTTATDIVGF